MPKFPLLTCFLFCASMAFGQLPKIDTDRPDQTESAFIVPKGWIQGELGFEKERTRAAYAMYSWTLPTLLSKYGVSKRLELRMITEFNRLGNKERFFKDSLGFLPLQLGYKINLFEGKGLIPRISLIHHLAFNRIASRMARGGSFLATNFRFTLQNTITDDIGLGYNLGMEWEDMREPPAYIYTLSPGFNFGEKWYAYIELFGTLRKGEAPEHAADGGIAYYINDNIKIDASAAIGISKAALKNYIGLGFSFRFNTQKKD